MSRRVRDAGLVLVVGIATHLDYHLGRSHAQPDSFDCPYHWVLGAAVGLVVGAVTARRSWRTGARILLIGLVLGQLVEPLLEGLFIAGEPWYPVDGERWRIFLEFLAASVAGLAAGHVIGSRRSRPDRAAA